MSIVKNILEKLSGIQKEIETAKVVFQAATLESGHTVEADDFVVGEQVTVTSTEGEEQTLPDGTYALDNGITITVDENGIITAAAPTEEAAKDEEEMAEEKPSTEAPVAKKTIETSSTSKETYFSKEDVEEMIATALAKQAESIEAQKTELEAIKTQLAAMPAEKPISRAPKTSPDAPFYAEPKTVAERLLNFQSQLNKQN